MENKMNKVMTVVLIGMSLLITSCGSNIWDVDSKNKPVDTLLIKSKNIVNGTGGNKVRYIINVNGSFDISWHSTNTPFDVGDELKFTLR